MRTRAGAGEISQIDSVHKTILSLMTDHGIFHCKLHYSSGRCSFWLMEDPYSYRIHGVEEFLEKNLGFWIGELAADRQAQRQREG
jgi:hypothetical protein